MEWTYDEVDQLTKHFLSFEWDNKEIQRYSLGRELTAGIYWHLVSNQFFPLNSYNLMQNFEEHFDENIRQQLLDREIPEKELLSLYNIDNFKERMEMIKNKFMTEQLLQSSVLPVIKDDKTANKAVKNAEKEAKEKEDKEHMNSIDSLLEFCQRYLDKKQTENDATVKFLSEKLSKTYDASKRREYETQIMQKWKETGVKPEEIRLWNIHDINTDLSQSIYFDVAAAFLEDCRINLNDYLSEKKNVLLDTWYSTKLEEEYLNYVAHKHQEKNEKNSKKLSERISDVQRQLTENVGLDSDAIVKNHPLTRKLLNERRQKEEDAKCLICGSGDYEENDLIVF